MFQLAIDVNRFVIIKKKDILFFSQNSDLLNNKMKYKNTTLSEQFQNPIEK